MKPQNAELDGRTGEGDLFAQLYPALRRFAAVVGPLEVEPDDLVQEAVERALRGGPLDRFDRLDAYLRKTMLNLASNHRRRLGRARRARTRLGGHQDLVTQGEYPSNVSDILALPPRARAIVICATSRAAAPPRWRPTWG